jgi:fatty-acyl-CoA synthase
MSPSGTAGIVRPGHEDSRWGPPIAGVEVRLRTDDGSLAEWDGVSQGEVEARGPWVARAYLRPDDDANVSRFTDDGWFRTGDIARAGGDGTLEIVDRAKDLIKSGGEWIPSLVLEQAILEHPDVEEVAVVAVEDPEWGERPAAVARLSAGSELELAQLRAFLEGRIASWWGPDRLTIVAELPRTGVGKYDKRVLRQRLRDG